MQQGRWILHEHPVGATSWQLDPVKKIMKMSGVKTVVGDQCQFGLTTRVDGGGLGPARKRTRFMSSAPSVLEELGRLCQGGHEHQPLVNDRAKEAALYPKELCEAICRGLMNKRNNADVKLMDYTR